jgi:dihydroorotase
MGSIAITNGTLVDGAGTRRADLLIQNGMIAEVGEKLDGDTIIDADGLVVTPGFVDLQVHFREPGGEEAETIQTGSRGAALGGFTAVVVMPNTTPTIDSPAVVRQIHDLSIDALCEVVPSAAITVDRDGEALAPMAELVRSGVRMFTDDGVGVQDARMMRTALEYASGLSHLADGFEIVLAQHCEVDALTAGAAMHEGEWSSRLGMPGQPAEAEELMIARDVALARLTDGRVHFQHVTTARGVDLIRAAKAEGLKVTGEATPHHLCLDHSAVASFDTVFKVNPPLRTPADVVCDQGGTARRHARCDRHRSCAAHPTGQGTPVPRRASRDDRRRDSVCDRQHRTRCRHREARRTALDQPGPHRRYRRSPRRPDRGRSAGQSRPARPR